MRPIARGMVAFARKPGPNTPPVELSPIRSRTAPFTTISGAGPEVDCQPPPFVVRSSMSASHAASTTGKYSGRHPAMAALMAAVRTVTSRSTCGMWPMTSSGASLVCARKRSSSGSLTGTSGNPSDQPWSYAYSMASRATSGSGAVTDPPP